MRTPGSVLVVVLSLLIVPLATAGHDAPPDEAVADGVLREIGHDPESGETVLGPPVATTSSSIASGLRSVAGALGAHEDGPTAENVIGPDGRSRVTPTTSYPWTAVVKVYFTLPDGGNAMCSGAMVSQRHVLTAGHCLHEGSGGGWSNSFRVLPAMDDGWDTGGYLDRPLGNNPYGAARVTYMRTYTGWTDNGDWNHDWGLLTLDRNLGSWTGWFGYFTADPSYGWYAGVQNTAGYPGDRDNGRNMYFHSEYGCSASQYKHWYSMDTGAGQSGSPVWVYSGGNRYIGTVHAYGGDGTSCSNSGTRLDDSKYNSLGAWIGQDGAASDKAELFERVHNSSWRTAPVQDITDFEPTLLGPGGTLNVRLPVRNGATASTGTYHVAFYLSTDTTITTGDRLIGEAAFSQGGLSVYDLQQGFALPTVGDGIYNIGWIIDNRFEVAEYDDHDTTNVGHKIGKTLRVDALPPAGTVTVQPIAVGQHLVSWVVRDDGSGVTLTQLQRMNTIDGAWGVICTQPANGQATLTGSCWSDEPLPGRYCFRLRMTDRAGNVGYSLQQCSTVVL